MGKSFRLPNGFGSIYKLSGNRRKPYAVSKTFGWDDQGNQIRKIIGYAETKKEGLELLLEFNQNPFSTVNQLDITLEIAFNKWIESCENNSELSKSNINSYQSVFRNYLVNIKNIKIKDLRTSEFQTQIDNCSKGYDTKRYIKMIASQVYKYCSNQLDMPLRKNFSNGLKIGSKEKSDLHHPLPYENINILWKNLDKIPFADSVLIMLYTGLRPGELVNIELKNIFLEERYMIGGIKTKAGIDRIIPINEKIVPLIEKLIHSNKKYLIENNNKKITYRYYLDLFTNIMKKLNLKHLPHDCRHTLATELDDLGISKLIIKLILGHAISDVTDMVYIHKKIIQLVEAINKIRY